MNKHNKGFVPGIWDMSKKSKLSPTLPIPTPVIGAWGVMVGGKLVPTIYGSRAEAWTMARKLGPSAAATYLSITPAASYEESIYVT